MVDRKPRVAVIGTAGLPARYGGFETLADHLTAHLAGDLDFTVYCPFTPVEARLGSYNGARLVYLPFKANGAQSVIYDVVSIVFSIFSFDRILILGSGGAVVLPFLFPFRRKFVLNFGGLEWARDKWGWVGRKYLKLAESLGVRFSGTVVADNQHFVDYVYSEYGVRSRLIEYGGDHCIVETEIDSALYDKYPFLNEKYFLSVSRAQVDNNIHLLLEAFEGLPDHKLVIVSNWGVSEYGRKLKGRYLGMRNVVLLDAIYDQRVLNQIRSRCGVYIHSHSFCGTAPSLVEIMSLGCPVFSYNAPTNVETTENQALFFATSGELQALVEGTSEADCIELGRKMKEIASRRYTWDVIARKYSEAFDLY